MRLNKFSSSEWDSICLHDKIMQTVQFDRLAQRLVVPILPENEWDRDHKIREMEFLNVLGFELSTCNFCGPSPHIQWFSRLSEEEERLIPKYYKEWCAQASPERFPGANCFEVRFDFTSGDTLLIACEEVVVKENL